jgi:hypothetical protein
MELNVKITLEEGQAKMRRWHFDQTKVYVKAFDATYVKIKELEDRIEEEELNDEHE